MITRRELFLHPSIACVTAQKSSLPPSFASFLPPPSPQHYLPFRWSLCLARIFLFLFFRCLFSLLLLLLPLPFQTNYHRNSVRLHFEMLTTTCHGYGPFKPHVYPFENARCVIFQPLEGQKERKALMPFNHWCCPVFFLSFFLLFLCRGSKFSLLGFKRDRESWSCCATSLHYPLPSFPSSPSPSPRLHYLDSGRGAHIAPCWLTCSHVVTSPNLLSDFNHLLLALCSPTTNTTTPKQPLLLLLFFFAGCWNCCRCSLPERLPFISMKVFVCGLIVLMCVCGAICIGSVLEYLCPQLASMLFMLCSRWLEYWLPQGLPAAQTLPFPSAVERKKILFFTLERKLQDEIKRADFSQICFTFN